MPTILQADSDSASEPSCHLSWHKQFIFPSGIYITAATAVCALVFLLSRLVLPRRTRPDCRKSSWQLLPLNAVSGSASRAGAKTARSSWGQRGQGQGQLEKQPIWLTDRAGASGTTALKGFSWNMEKDTIESRGVSTRSSSAADLTNVPSSFSLEAPYAATSPSPPLQRSADGSQVLSTGEGKERMDSSPWEISGVGPTIATRSSISPGFEVTDDQPVAYSARGLDRGSTDAPDGSGRRFDLTFSRPPPPPPLTPPTLVSSATIPAYIFENRRHPTSYAHSTTAELDTISASPTSYIDIHQPNPDYITATSSSIDAAEKTAVVSSLSNSTGVPRRRSYTKTIPIPAPPPSQAAGASLDQSFSVWNPGAEKRVNPVSHSFSPSSYPSTSPLLPPPPLGYRDFSPEPRFDGHDVRADHIADGRAEDAHGSDDAPGAHHTGSIDVQGEIISVLDGAGAGWKRHTRVYGGGVCLACAAAGSSGHGGFYGARVRPEDKR